MMSENKFMWAHLLHLGVNMWNEVGNTRGRETRSTKQGVTEVTFYRDLWDAHIEDLKKAGVNTLIIDLAEALQYKSHPEISVKGAWTHEEMRREIERLEAMGFEVIPKLNFSAGHDVWLGVYSRMVSTPTYYQVCKDLIEEVCALFHPRFFHLGMDEETPQNQRNLEYLVIRQHDLWWHDFLYLVDIVEKCGARAMIWSDYMWDYPELFFERMPKSVVQCGWYYWGYDGTLEGLTDGRKKMLTAFRALEEHGYDQLPTGSVWADPDNLKALTRYCMENVSPEHWLGMMQTVWEHIEPDFMGQHKLAVDGIIAAKAWYEQNKK